MTASFALGLTVVFGATLVRATFGFGEALIAMPLLSMLFGLQFAAPCIALTSVTLALLILAQDWRHVQLASASRLTAAALAGIPCGLALLWAVDERIVKTLLAAVVLLFAAFSLVRPASIRLTSERSAWIFGFLGGVLGGAYNTGGPPVVIYGSLRGWESRQFRATLQGYFLPTSIVVAASHAAAGRVTGAVLQFYGAALVAIFVSAAVGGWLHRRLDAERFKPLVHGLLAVIGLSLLANVWL